MTYLFTHLALFPCFFYEMPTREKNLENGKMRKCVSFEKILEMNGVAKALNDKHNKPPYSHGGL